MLSVLLLRIFFVLALAAIVGWVVAKVWPRASEPQLPLSTMTEQELRSAKATLEEKRRQLTNLKAIAEVNRAIAKVDHELATIERRAAGDAAPAAGASDPAPSTTDTTAPKA